MSSPRCYENFDPGKYLCESCYARGDCRRDSTAETPSRDEPEDAEETSGSFRVDAFDLALTLYSGQTFRWGRDTDGWWKGIAYGVAFHLRQEGETVRFVASAPRVFTYADWMDTGPFLRWYLRIDECPRIRVPRADRHLRKARDLMRGYRFMRQDPWECIVSYILSVQAHMALTKQRIQFLSQILGDPVRLRNEQYWVFPAVDRLALLNESYYRYRKFGWRSRYVPTSVACTEEMINREFGGDPSLVTLEGWRRIVDSLRSVPNSGVGLKVAKCIDLFSLARLNAVPVDTWVRKLAADWYGVEGSDAKICAWGEERGGKLAGYWNEYLFVYYRELNAPALDDKVLSFSSSDAPSTVLPYVPASG